MIGLDNIKTKANEKCITILEALVSPKRLKKGTTKAMAYALLPINFLLELVCFLSINFKKIQLIKEFLSKDNLLK